MRTFLSVLVVFGLLGPRAAAPAAAQEETALVAEATEGSVRLRWTMPEAGLPDSAFVVEREDDAGDTRTWTVASPMLRSAAVGRGLIGDEEYEELVDAFSDDAERGEDVRQRRELNRAAWTLLGITRPALPEVLGIVFDDTSAVPGTDYAYRVTTTVEGAAVAVGEAEVTAGDVETLPAPTGLAGEADETGIGLRWDLPEEGFIVAFRVYREDPDGSERELTGGGVFVSRVEDAETGEPRLPEVFLRDTAVAANTTYAYTVVGLNVFGRETPRSEPVSVFFPDPEPLDVPLVTAVDVRDRETELFWMPPTDRRVTGIGVLRYEDPMQQGTLLTPVFLPASAASFVDTAVVGGVSYYYSLVTVDANGRQFGPSPPWAARAINLSPPSAPTNLSLAPTAEGLELSWDAPPEPDVRGYEVFILRGVGTDGDAETRRVLVTRDLVPERSYSLPVPPGTLDSLTLAVRAVNTSFVEGPLSDPATGAILDTVPPGRPILARVHAGEGSIHVAWRFTGDPDVTGYQVRRSVQGEEGFTVVREDLAAADTAFTDADVTPGLLHVYTVEAVDASGNVSAPSSPLAATPYRLTPPAAPRQVEARLLEDGGVEVRWEPPTGVVVVLYVVERSAGDGRFVQLGEPILAGTRAYTDPTGRPGLSYRVFAIDAAGNFGEPSNATPVRDSAG